MIKDGRKEGKTGREEGGNMENEEEKEERKQG